MGAYGNKNEVSRKSKNTAPEPNARTDFRDFKFVRIELSQEEKSEFRGLLGSGEIEPLDLDGLVSEGYSLTISLDRDGKTVFISLKQLFVDGSNTGCILTARHSSATGALAALSYKINNLIGNRFWREAEMARGGEYEDGLG